jgi:hypothetical protein
VLGAILGLVAASAAAPKQADDEVIVYGDQFARWDHTRWLLQSELWLPLGMDFASDDNFTFRSFGFQIRAVVLCDKDARLAKHRWEVSCAVEELGLLATTENRWRTERDREIAAAVLEAVDQRLTGARVQMQVDDEGGITNFDLEGVDATNQRERRIQETTRQMMSRVMAGFHLRIPDQAQRSGQWVEYNSELIDLPSLAAARGSTALLHQVSPYKEFQLVQSLGEGSVTVSLPKDSKDPFHPGIGGDFAPDTSNAGGPGFGALADTPTAAPLATSAFQSRESGIESTFKVNATGVALFEKQTGIMIERVWEATGRATASSPWGMGAYRNLGRIRRLEPAEVVDVGPTQQVSWPTQELDGLPPWVPFEGVPKAGAGGPG